MGNRTTSACLAAIVALACWPASAQEGQTAAPSTTIAEPAKPALEWFPQNSYCGGVVRVYMAPPPKWLSADPVAAGDAIHQRRDTLNALCLFEGAYLLTDRDLDRAGLLFAMARLRARYDVARCKQPDAARGYMSAAQVYEMSPPPALAAAIEADAAANKRWILAALAEPKLFSDSASLESVCRPGGGAKPRGQWKDVEKQLRDSWGKQAQ